MTTVSHRPILLLTPIRGIRMLNKNPSRISKEKAIFSAWPCKSLQFSNRLLLLRVWHISVTRIGLMGQPSAMNFRVWLRVVDDSTLLVEPMACASCGITRAASSPGALLRRVGIIPWIRLRSGVLIILIGRTAISRLRHCGSGACHGSVVRGAEVILGALFLVVCLLFRNHCAAVAKCTKLFLVMGRFRLALEEEASTGAGGVVVGGRRSVFLLLLVLSIQENSQDSGEEKEEARWSG